MLDILVIGSGVAGLTTGLCLLEAGHRVTIWAKDLPPNTTSNVAAAVWYPYKAYPVARVTHWSQTTWQKFKALQADPVSGISLANMIEVKPVPTPDPWWAGAVDDFRHARPEELPPGYADGFAFASPVIDTRVYLDYLFRMFRAHQGVILQRAIGSLAEAFAQRDVVINCSGLGARELVGDHDLHPAKGQVIRIKPTGFRGVVLDEDGPNSLAYIVPRRHDIVLGGTYEEHNESLAVDADATQAILRRCAQLAPAFAAVAEEDIVSIVCGLRPVRSTVRVEAEWLTPERLLVHNYGHGGAGITLSWGCATEVVQLIAGNTGSGEERTENLE